MNHPTQSTAVPSFITAALILLSGAAIAATYTVDNLTDEVDGELVTDISLRDAVIAANATADDDIIVIPAGTCTLTLTGAGEDACATGDLDIADSATAGTLTIQGAGADTTIIDAGGSGGLDDRVIHLLSGSSLTLENLTLTGGRTTGDNDTGGGIYSYQGTLTLANCALSDNQTSGRYAHGGGIRIVNAALSLAACTVSDNHASGTDANGGGIHSDTSVTVFVATLTNCTIHGNSAGKVGGGIYNFDGQTTLTHCTITGNVAPAGQGGGIAGWGNPANTPTELTSTIVRDNTGGDVTYVFGATNSFISHDGNIIGDGNATAAFSQPHDQVGTTTPHLLAPLGNYGGTTATRPPLPGSPAIEGGVLLAGTPPTDQLGGTRPMGPLPDTGSVEAIPLHDLGLDDTDGDGIPDIFEGPDGPYTQLTVGVDDSTLDTDGDGHTDAEEIANMTNLFDPDDFLRILSIEPAPGFVPVTNPLFRITVKTAPGMSYVFESNPLLTGSFSPVPSSGFSATDPTTTTDVLLAPTRDFVRIRRD